MDLAEGFKKVSLSELPLYDFVGPWTERWVQTRSFLLPLLWQYESPAVLDLAMGTGADTIALLKEGCRVTANEVDEVGIERAHDDAKEAGLSLSVRKVFWEKMMTSPEYRDNEFEFAFSLGNSFPNYLLSRSDRELSLRGFWRILKPGGTLVFDARNFDYMLKERSRILENPERNFRYDYQTTYVGKKVRGFPIKIEEERIRLMWKHRENRRYAEMDVWPATVDAVSKLVTAAIGDVPVQVFFDYQSEKPEHYDFAQFVIRKG